MGYIELNYDEIHSKKCFSPVGQILGKYEVLQLIEGGDGSHSSIKYKVRCIKCGWEGLVTYKSILKSQNNSYNKKCSHIGGSTIKPGSVFGKYIVIKRAPSKLCNNGLLVPYYTCICSKCGKKVKVTSATLYATIGRHEYENAKCRHEEGVLPYMQEELLLVSEYNE